VVEPTVVNLYNPCVLALNPRWAVVPAGSFKYPVDEIVVFFNVAM
jgi:hypothetical protein